METHAVHDLDRWRPVTVAMTMAAILFWPGYSMGQQKELPDITIATAVSNLAYSALWVAEQLKYFEQEGVRAKITVAGGGAPCQTSVVGRSTHFCASSSENLILANQEGAVLLAVQAHNRNITVGLTVRKAIADKFKHTARAGSTIGSQF